MRAGEIADILDEIGRLLDFRGGDPFKARAYRNAAGTLRELDEPLDAVIAAGRLRELPYIGAAISEKIERLVQTGSLPLLERLREETPPGVLDLLSVPGLGPVRARAAHRVLGIDSLDALEAAALSGRLAEVAGFGPKTVAAVLASLSQVRKYAGRFLAMEARAAARPLLARLEAHPAAAAVAIAGGLRRRIETVHDVDLVAASDEPEAVLDAFVDHPSVVRFTARGGTKATVRLAGGIPADLRVVPPRSFPFALQYFTGSQAHNVRLRGIARRKGLKLNEYGLYPIGGANDEGAPGVDAGDGPIPAPTVDAESLDCSDEAAVYAALGLSWIPPELREDRGEIEAAARGALPDLVELQDLRGVVHCHTTWSDGRASIAEMAKAAATRGYSYLVVCDHGPTSRGLDAEDLAIQRMEIESVNAAGGACRVLAGIEVDILVDGSLDLPDEALAGLECVVASLHRRHGLSSAAQTERVLRALSNPWVDILGHPTGRLLLRREEAGFDVEKVLDAAAEHGVILEVNANPDRLDLDWRWHQAALARGVRLSIDPDAHGPETIDILEEGVAIARKGWVTAENVANARDADGFLAALRRNRESD